MRFLFVCFPTPFISKINVQICCPFAHKVKEKEILFKKKKKKERRETPDLQCYTILGWVGGSRRFCTLTSQSASRDITSATQRLMCISGGTGRRLKSASVLTPQLVKPNKRSFLKSGWLFLNFSEPSLPDLRKQADVSQQEAH